jgi:hypothetical protein
MATRKSGDGPRGADEADVSPGSYAKVSGSRRKRKKKGRSMPPSAPPSGATEILTPRESLHDGLEDVVDTEGVDTSDPQPGRHAESEWGAGRGDERDLSVDDLRRRPISSRAPRRPHGPLGMEDAPAEPEVHADLRSRAEEPSPSRSAAQKLSSPLPPTPAAAGSPARMRVVEINPPETDNTNALWGDEEDQEQDSDEFELSSVVARTQEDFHGIQSTQKGVRALHDASPALARQSQEDPRDDDEEVSRLLDERLRESNVPLPRHSFSSVLGARPSLRPSPPPPPEKVSLLWWLMVTLLSSIIIAAGVIAFREAMHKGEQVADPEQSEPVAPGPSEPSPYDVRKAPSSNGHNSATITSSPSAFPPASGAVRAPSAPAAPLAPAAKATEPSAPATPAGAANKPTLPTAPVQPAPVASKPTPAVAASAPTHAPVPAGRAAVVAPVARPPAPRPAPRPRAAAAPAPAPAAAPAPVTEIERPIGAAQPAPAPEPQAPAAPPPEPAPLNEEKLPINPYAE